MEIDLACNYTERFRTMMANPVINRLEQQLKEQNDPAVVDQLVVYVADYMYRGGVQDGTEIMISLRNIVQECVNSFNVK